MRNNPFGAGAVAYLVSGLLACTCLAGESAITRPSDERTLSFPQPGQVKQIFARPGDRVKAGQVLIQLDDEAERAQLESLQAQAEDGTRILAAKATLAQKNVDLRKFEKAFEDGVATEMEVQHAKLDVLIAELSVKLETFRVAQDRRRYNEAKIRVAKMRLISPISGIVTELPKRTPRDSRQSVDVGESVDALEPVVWVVQINPLQVDVAVPIGDAADLRLAQTAHVEFGKDWRSAGRDATGKIVYISSVADSASRRLTIRLEVPNPAGRPAGEHVQVSFVAPAQASRPDPRN